MPDLSILIPARNEEWLQRTIKDIEDHKEGDTEILWEEDTEPMGQRALTNKLARQSKAKYVMKVDAHCSFSQGFDVKMMEDIDDRTIMAPSMMNLHAYDWNCPEHMRNYQGPKCCDKAEKIEVWQPKYKPILSNYEFTKDLIFNFSPKQDESDITETMCLQGSAWMVSREMYFDLNLCDEEFGSWGQQGVELGCKGWLSGGRAVTTRKAYYAHLFRKEEEFPYQRDMKQVDHAHQYSKDLFIKNNWDKAQYDFMWLIDKFNYPQDWRK